MSIRAGALVAAFVIIAAGLGGCSDSDSEAGFGLPTLAPQAQRDLLAESGVSAAPLSGTLIVERNGCFTFRNAADDGSQPAWIVWPDTARPDGGVVLLGSGEAAGQGARLDASGAYIDLSDLPDGASTASYFGSFGRFCGADKVGVVLIADVELEGDHPADE